MILMHFISTLQKSYQKLQHFISLLSVEKCRKLLLFFSYHIVSFIPSTVRFLAFFVSLPSILQ